MLLCNCMAPSISFLQILISRKQIKRMQTSSVLLFQPPLTPVGAPFSGKPPLQFRRRGFVNRHLLQMAAAFKKDNYGPGKMVDENMIVLRERIRKMKAEENDESCRDDRDNWMQWEKTYTNSGGYHSDVYEGVEFLQRFLMESRPSVALGLVALLALGASTAALTALHSFMNLITSR